MDEVQTAHNTKCVSKHLQARCQVLTSHIPMMQFLITDLRLIGISSISSFSVTPLREFHSFSASIAITMWWSKRVKQPVGHLLQLSYKLLSPACKGAMICSFKLIICFPLSTHANYNFANVNIHNDKHDPVWKLLPHVSKSLCQLSLISSFRFWRCIG